MHYDAHRHRFLIAELGEGYALVIDCFTGRRFERDELMIRMGQGKSMSNTRFLNAFEEGFVYALDGELELLNVDDSFREWKLQTFNRGLAGSSRTAALSNGCLVVISCFMRDSEIKVWDTKTSKCLGSVIIPIDELLDVFTDGERIVVQSQWLQDLDEPGGFFAVIDFASLDMDNPPLIQSSTVERPWDLLGGPAHIDWPTQTITTVDIDAARSMRFDGSVLCWPESSDSASAHLICFGPPGPVRWAATINTGEDHTNESIEVDEEDQEAEYHRVESIHLHPFLAQGVVVYEYKAVAFSFNHEETPSS